jgi:hypothetical protein
MMLKSAFFMIFEFKCIVKFGFLSVSLFYGLLVVECRLPVSGA